MILTVFDVVNFIYSPIAIVLLLYGAKSYLEGEYDIRMYTAWYASFIIIAVLSCIAFVFQPGNDLIQLVGFAISTLASLYMKRKIRELVL